MAEAVNNVNTKEDAVGDDDDDDDKETYNLVIKNVPNPSVKTIRSLRAWIIQLTKEKSVGVTFSGTSHFAHFVNVSTGPEEMIDMLKNTTYNDLTLDIEDVKIVKRIHVSNLREDVTEDEITLYFEQPHFLPKNLKEDEEFYVSVMHLDKRKRFALVKLPHSADISLYINATHSNILGDIKVVDGKTNRKPRPKTWKEWKQRWNPNRLDRRGKEKLTGSVEVLADLTGNVSDEKSPVASRDHSVKSQRSECSRGSDKGRKSCDTNVNTIKNFSQATNNSRGRYRYPNPVQRHPQFHKSFNQTSEQKPVKKGVDYKSDIDDCHIRMIVSLGDELAKEKGELLRKFIKPLTKKFGEKDLKIWIDFANHEVHLGHLSDEQKLQEVADCVEVLLASAESCDVNLPQPLADICSLYFISVKIRLIEFLNRHDVQVIPYLNSSGTLSVLAENEEAATKAAKFFEESYKDRFITVTGDQSDPPVQNFLTHKWRNFVTDLARRFFVDVSVKTDDPDAILISLAGLDDGKSFLGAIYVIKKEIATMGGCIVSVIGDLKNENANTMKYKRENFERKRFPPKMQNKGRAKSVNSCFKDSDSRHMDSIPSRSNAKKCMPMERENEFNPKNDDKIMIKMSPLEFKYLKLGLPNIICDEVQFNSIGSFLEISGSEESRNDRKVIIEETMSMFVKKDFHYSMPGITYNFYKEKNSPLKTLLMCLEKDVKCAFDASASTEGPGIVIHCICSISNVRSVEDILMNALKKMIDEKIISYSFILKKSAKTTYDCEGDNRRMDGRLVKEINNQANENVSVSIDEKSESVVLKGRKTYVLRAETFINKLFLNYLKKAPVQQEDKPSILTLNSPLRQRNPSEFLKLYGHQDIQAPAHWQSHQGSLRSLSSNEGIISELDKSSTLYNIISCMVYDSWSDDGTFMFDASSAFKDPIQIEKIYSIENVYLYKRYMTKINEFCLQNHDKIDGLSKQTLSIQTRKLTDSEPLLLHEINECYLFHGTDAANRQAIIDQGLDFRLGSSSSLFGKGIYFAESCTKAHFYTERAPNEDTYCVFVARVFLGNMHHCDSAHPYKRPPCSDALCRSDTCHMHPLCDSVMGTNTYNDRLTRCIALRKKRDDIMTSANLSSLTELNDVNDELKRLSKYLFREFIVYDQSQCYPEFLVEYKKLKNEFDLW